MAINSPETLVGGSVVLPSNNYEEVIDVEPPPLKDCKIQVIIIKGRKNKVFL